MTIAAFLLAHGDFARLRGAVALPALDGRNVLADAGKENNDWPSRLDHEPDLGLLHE